MGGITDQPFLDYLTTAVNAFVPDENGIGNISQVFEAILQKYEFDDETNLGKEALNLREKIIPLENIGFVRL